MVNPAALSKINWTQAIGFIAMMGTVFGFDFPAETQASIVAAIVAIQSTMTIVFRTWFTVK